jgi:hypothetical protein
MNHLPRITPLHLLTLITACGILLSACNLGVQAPPQQALGPYLLVTANPRAIPTATPFQPAQPTATSILPTPILPTPTQVPPTPTPLPPTPTSTPAPTQPPPNPTGERTQYTMYLVLDYADQNMKVDETINYTNHTGAILNELILAVEPNLWGGAFALVGLNVDGAVANYSLSGQSMQITLPLPLQPGSAVTITLQFYLYIPYKSARGIFGYDGYQVNLIDWYPFVVPYVPGQGWLLHNAWPDGEHLVYDASDFEINLRQTDPSMGLVIAASAPGEANGDWTRYRLKAGRSFTLAASPYFQVTSIVAGNVVVNSYYYAGNASAGQAVADYVGKAMQTYSSHFGPAPYPILSIVETDYPDGMESDGLIFLSSAFYSQYDGTPQNNLTSIGVHEAAHQWWFALVGNDQAMQPWLDEALALYSERVFYEDNYPYLVSWWWNFRVYYFQPGGWVDTNIYNAGGFRPYVNAVYLRGAEFLEDLRVRIGDQAFFGFLQDYAARYAHGRATSADFFALLRQHTSANISDLLNAYFQGDY